MSEGSVHLMPPGKGEGFTDFIRIYEGNFSSSAYRSVKLEPKTSVESIIELILVDKGLPPQKDTLAQYCLVEADPNYDIERVLVGMDVPFPSFQNLDRNEQGLFLVRKKSLIDSLVQQKAIEISFEKVESLEDAQIALDDLLLRVNVNFEVPDFRRSSQDNDSISLKESSNYDDFLKVSTELLRNSVAQRRLELRNSKFDTESQKGKLLMKRRTTTKLSNFFGVSKREAEVATIRNKVSKLDPLEQDEEPEPGSEVLSRVIEKDDDDDELAKKKMLSARERQRTLKLASFFGVNQSEVEIRELRKLLENLDSDERDNSNLEEFDMRKARDRTAGSISIKSFLTKKIIPDPPLLFQVRSTIDVDEVGKRFQEGVHKEEYVFRFVTYEKCFQGKDAVDWLCAHALPNASIPRQEAVALGNLLLNKGLFFHIQRKHEFQDRHFYYQFADEVKPREESEDSKGKGEKSKSRISLVDVPVNVIRKEGWLSRYDPKKREWHRYWCSVENMTLNIRTEPVLSLPNSKPDVLPFKTLNLEGCSISPMDPKKFTFEIKKPNLKTALFATDSVDHLVQWINAIKIASRIHPLAGDSTDDKQVSLEDFEFLKVIGKGTSGKVFLCVEKRSGKVLAMKILKKSDINGPKHLKGARIEHRILREIHHPFIVELHYAFQSNDRLYFAMDYLSGGELFHHICEQGAFSENRARFYAAEIFLALQYLHLNGIVYRDLKLENIMMDKEGHIKITDFGMCKDELKAGMRTNSICGTSEYLPPEIILRTRYGFSVDWWTFGVVLFEMLCGEHPFYSEDKETLYTNILYKQIDYPPTLSPEARSILEGLLERDPEDRLGSDDQRDGQAIREHPFFSKINFDKLLRKEILPPFLPQIETMTDVSYFDPDFTDEPVIMTPVDQMSVFENKFEGFSYVAEQGLWK